MTGFQPASESTPRDGEFRPLLDPSADPPDQEASGATAFQRELSDALGAEDGHSTHINDRPASPGIEFWDVALGTLGIASLLVGVVLVFFFAAAGAIVLLLGGLVCGMAFSGSMHSSERPSQSRSP